MNFKNKYLKYKQKYLDLKQQYGGNFEVDKYDSLNNYSEDIEQLNHMVTPMNAYNIVNKDDNNILTTTGVVDCVVVLIYNKNYGRYIGHFLKFNEFEKELSNACEINKHPDCNLPSSTPINCIDVDLLSHGSEIKQSYIKGSKKIANSLPVWINDINTIIHIVNSSDVFKVYSRYKQIFTKFPNVQIKLYLKKLEYSDKRLFGENGYEKEFIESLDIKLKEQNSGIVYQIFGIKPNGDIFGIKKDDLKIKKYQCFYNSITINRIVTPNINKRCIQPYVFDMKLYDKNFKELDDMTKLSNFDKNFIYTPYNQEFFKFIQSKN